MVTEQPMLTNKQKQFANLYALLGNASEAARQAGYSERSAKVTACRLLTKANVAHAVAERRAEYAAELQITKEDVIAGVLSAVEMARRQENPAAMIQGCSALARLLGYFTPETARVEIGLDAAAVGARMAALSDADLLAMAQGRCASNRGGHTAERR